MLYSFSFWSCEYIVDAPIGISPVCEVIILNEEGNNVNKYGLKDCKTWDLN
jgi:hypothetical protein